MAVGILSLLSFFLSFFLSFEIAQFSMSSSLFASAMVFDQRPVQRNFCSNKAVFCKIFSAPCPLQCGVQQEHHCPLPRAQRQWASNSMPAPERNGAKAEWGQGCVGQGGGVPPPPPGRPAYALCGGNHICSKAQGRAPVHKWTWQMTPSMQPMLTRGGLQGNRSRLPMAEHQAPSRQGLRLVFGLRFRTKVFP